MRRDDLVATRNDDRVVRSDDDEIGVRSSDGGGDSGEFR